MTKYSRTKLTAEEMRNLILRSLPATRQQLIQITKLTPTSIWRNLKQMLADDQVHVSEKVLANSYATIPSSIYAVGPAEHLPVTREIERCGYAEPHWLSRHLFQTPPSSLQEHQ